MKPPHQHALTEYVPVHGFQNIGARRVRSQVELGVEREQFKSIVMIGTRSGSAGAHEADPPRRFFAWTVPSGMVASAGMPSGSEVALPGMLNIIQWRTSPVLLLNGDIRVVQY